MQDYVEKESKKHFFQREKKRIGEKNLWEAILEFNKKNNEKKENYTTEILHRVFEEKEVEDSERINSTHQRISEEENCRCDIDIDDLGKNDNNNNDDEVNLVEINSENKGISVLNAVNSPFEDDEDDINLFKILQLLKEYDCISDGEKLKDCYSDDRSQIKNDYDFLRDKKKVVVEDIINLDDEAIFELEKDDEKEIDKSKSKKRNNAYSSNLDGEMNVSTPYSLSTLINKEKINDEPLDCSSSLYHPPTPNLNFSRSSDAPSTHQPITEHSFSTNANILSHHSIDDSFATSQNSSFSSSVSALFTPSSSPSLSLSSTKYKQTNEKTFSTLSFNNYENINSNNSGKENTPYVVKDIEKEQQDLKEEYERKMNASFLKNKKKEKKKNEWLKKLHKIEVEKSKEIGIERFLIFVCEIRFFFMYVFSDFEEDDKLKVELKHIKVMIKLSKKELFIEEQTKSDMGEKQKEGLSNESVDENHSKFEKEVKKKNLQDKIISKKNMIRKLETTKRKLIEKIKRRKEMKKEELSNLFYGGRNNEIINSIQTLKNVEDKILLSPLTPVHSSTLLRNIHNKYLDKQTSETVEKNKRGVLDYKIIAKLNRKKVSLSSPQNTDQSFSLTSPLKSPFFSPLKLNIPQSSLPRNMKNMSSFTGSSLPASTISLINNIASSTDNLFCSKSKDEKYGNLTKHSNPFYSLSPATTNFTVTQLKYPNSPQLSFSSPTSCYSKFKNDEDLQNTTASDNSITDSTVSKKSNSSVSSLSSSSSSCSSSLYFPYSKNRIFYLQFVHELKGLSFIFIFHYNNLKLFSGHESRPLHVRISPCSSTNISDGRNVNKFFFFNFFFMK
jgi:hypothetical protein